MALRCDPCGKSFSGIASYNQHIESEKHKKKMSMVLFQTRNTELQSTFDKPADISTKIPCDVCNVFFDSFESFQHHAMTLEHASNVGKNSQNNTVTNSSFGIVSSTIPNDYTRNDNINDTILPSRDEKDSILPTVPSFAASSYAPFMECKTCNKQFSGPEPYKQHMVSANHKKKVEMENFISSAGLNQNASNVFSCEPCKKVFSGQIPLEQHLVSDVHKKKIKNIQLLEQFKGNKEFQAFPVSECDSSLVNNTKNDSLEFQNMDMNNPWFCKICLIQCSGLIPFQQHIAGETHWKNKRRADAAKNYATTDIKFGNPSVGVTNASISNNLVAPNTAMYPEINQSRQGVGQVPRPVQMHEACKNDQDLESDVLLPKAEGNLLVSIDKINIKEFLPDEKINFDYDDSKDLETEKRNFDSESKNFEDRREKENSEGFAKERKIDTEEKADVFQECKLCNVQLRSNEDALSHFESMEHFKKRWSSN